MDTAVSSNTMKPLRAATFIFYYLDQRFDVEQMNKLSHTDDTNINLETQGNAYFEFCVVSFTA